LAVRFTPVQSELKLKLLEVEGDVPQCLIAGDATGSNTALASATTEGSNLQKKSHEQDFDDKTKI